MSDGSVDAVILSGGMGTRLAGVLGDRPKALAPIAGRPFLGWMLAWLRGLGVERVVLCTGHGAEQIETFLREPAVRELGLELVCVRDPAPLGTGGALRHALGALHTPRLLVLNGDSYCPFDPAQLEDAHRAAGAAATLLLTRVDDTSRFGAVERDAAGWITAFREKAASGGAGWINAGVYLLERDAIEALPAGRALSLEREFFAARVGHGLLGVESEGPFIDIGTPESYAEAERRIDWRAVAGAAA